MNPWDLTLALLGWVVFTCVAIVVFVVVLSILAGIVLLLISIVQTIVASIRRRRTPPTAPAPATIVIPWSNPFGKKRP